MYYLPRSIMVEAWELMHKPHRDVSEHSAGAARALDKAKQLHRERKFRQAARAFEELAKEMVRASIRCDEDAEREERKARLNVLA
jgi:hypothetical protein